MARSRIAVALLVAIASCGGADGDEVAPASSDIRIAVVASGAPDDRGWTQGLVDLAMEFVGQDNVDVHAGTTSDDAAERVREAAAGGAAIVIAHDAGFGTAVRGIAPEYPDITFLVSTKDAGLAADNISTYRVAAQQGAFVLGTLAGALSSSGIVGVVATDHDDHGYAEGFAAGALDSGGVEVLVAAGHIDDIAEQHVSAGADVLAAGLEWPTPGGSDNVAWFGNQVATAGDTSDSLVASQVFRWDVIFERVVAQRSQGVSGGTSYVLDLAGGGLELVFNDAYPLPQGFEQAAMITAQSVIDGEIEVVP